METLLEKCKSPVAIVVTIEVRLVSKEDLIEDKLFGWSALPKEAHQHRKMALLATVRNS